MHVSIYAETLFYLFGFPVTNSMIVAWAVSALLIIMGLLATRQLRQVPSGLQNFFEALFDAILGVIDSVTRDRQKSIRFFPLITTIFIFVLSVNWAGLLPGVGAIGIVETHDGKESIIPLFRATSADLNFTLMLALLSMIIVQIVGVASIGFGKYAAKFLNFSSPINFFVGILELVSEFAKVISFTFRLFGNIFAGEVLLAVMLFLVPYFIPLPFMALEVFVGFIQALVFAMLTLVFMQMASEEAHH